MSERSIGDKLKTPPRMPNMPPPQESQSELGRAQLVQAMRDVKTVKGMKSRWIYQVSMSAINQVLIFVLKEVIMPSAFVILKSSQIRVPYSGTLLKQPQPLLQLRLMELIKPKLRCHFLSGKELVKLSPTWQTTPIVLLPITMILCYSTK